MSPIAMTGSGKVSHIRIPCIVLLSVILNMFDFRFSVPCSTLPPGLIDDPSYIILRLLEVALWPGLASLDLAQMPRPVRTTLYRDSDDPCMNIVSV